jgi:hypothetical protein
MEIIIKFRSGAEFAWKSVKSRELNSIFTDVAVLAEKDEAARMAFKRQGKLNGTKKAVRKVNKGTQKGA